jgi:ArsR family metal-binding transcriptional regulator
VVGVLIETFDLEILTPPCEPGAERFFAKARLSVDISEVLPYLNSVLDGTSFTPAAKALTWMKDGHKVAFHAHEIDISGIESRDWAEEAITELVELVNRTWDRRDELTPSYETPQPLTPMAVYQQLPQTNCRLCGEATCFNFALKLATSQKTLADCPPLFEREYAENLAALQTALEAAGASG